jgi:hypothetical protein
MPKSSSKSGKSAKVPIRTRLADRPQVPEKRKRGRPAKSVATGMADKTFNRKCSEFDAAIRPVVESMSSPHFRDCFVSELEYLNSDPDLLNCWHFAKLDSRSRALVQMGENAVSLVNSYPATARERTTLRQHLSQSMFNS